MSVLTNLQISVAQMPKTSQLYLQVQPLSLHTQTHLHMCQFTAVEALSHHFVSKYLDLQCRGNA